MCTKNGSQISNLTELLLRQVDPAWLDDEGEPSSQNFYPWRDIDHGCLSVDRGAVTTAAAAHSLFTAPRPDGFGKSSQGVWGLGVSELSTIGLSAWEDPRLADDLGPANSAHAVIEFNALSATKWKSAGKRLKRFALSRGRLFPSGDPTQSAAPTPQASASPAG